MNITEQIARDRQNNFNLLRLVFAVLVLFSHSFELVDGNRSREILTSVFHTISFGELAVDGFFLLSGYLIVQSWQSRPHALPFLKNRILRIYPGFIVASLVCILIVAPLGSNWPNYFSHYPFGPVLANSFLLNPPLTRPVFVGQPYPLVNGAMWTILYEFECYLAVLVLGLLGGVGRRKVWLCLTLLIFGLLGALKFGIHLPEMVHLDNDDAVTHLRLSSFFFAGGCFYLFKERTPFNPKFALASAVALILLMFNSALAEIALAILGGYLLFKFAFMPSRFLSGFLKLPDISYGVYLYGWPTQKLLRWYYPTMSPWILFTLTCCACLMLGLVSWYGVERPFLRLKARAASRLASSGAP